MPLLRTRWLQEDQNILQDLQHETLKALLSPQHRFHPLLELLLLGVANRARNLRKLLAKFNDPTCRDLVFLDLTIRLLLRCRHPLSPSRG